MVAFLSASVSGSRDDWALEDVVSFDLVSKIALNRLDMESMGISVEVKRRA
jgi:hypothetical protein